jgi:hypothetical protein
MGSVSGLWAGGVQMAMISDGQRWCGDSQGAYW